VQLTFVNALESLKYRVYLFTVSDNGGCHITTWRM